VVVPISPGEARDGLDIREALECSAVRRITGGGVPLPPLARRMEEIIAEPRRHAEAGGPAGFAGRDEAGFREMLRPHLEAASYRTLLSGATAIPA
jgi:DNA-binding GntR family transcriptional regulator